MPYVLALVVLCADCAVRQELPGNTSDIKTLTVEQAKALAQHEGGLILDGLTTLSDEPSKALAQHKGELSLNRLTAISAEAAASLRANPKILLHNKLWQ